MQALEKDFYFVNQQKPSTTGILDLALYLNRIEVLFLNWPEEIPGRKGDIWQVAFFVCALVYCKIRGIKIIWTLHNRESHYEVRKKMKRFLVRFVARKAYEIITHSKEGIEVARKLAPGRAKPAHFIHHPVMPVKDLPRTEKKFDLLIWGTIAPYKGVDVFLDYVKRSDLSKYSLLIVGRITKEWQRPLIHAHQSTRVVIVDSYISLDNLEQYIAQSRIVLFTYAHASILSSGALMDTLIYYPAIIGPDSGTFRELAALGLIDTYKDFDDLTRIVPEVLKRSESPTEAIKAFCIENTWEKFGAYMCQVVGK
jgi:glycosyltransferase involved in cell wall biosynthesis